MNQTDRTREHLIETYRKKAKHYDTTSRLYPAPGYPQRAQRLRTVQALALRPGDTVIDMACGTGLNFALIHQAPVESRLWPLLFARISATMLVIIVAAASRNLRVPSGKPLRLALTLPVLDASANVAMLLALHASLLSLSSVLISLYPVATVVLAMAVLRERVTRWQALGMILAAVSVSMIAAT